MWNESWKSEPLNSTVLYDWLLLGVLGGWQAVWPTRHWKGLPGKCRDNKEDAAFCFRFCFTFSTKQLLWEKLSILQGLPTGISLSGKNPKLAAALICNHKNNQYVAKTGRSNEMLNSSESYLTFLKGLYDNLKIYPTFTSQWYCFYQF